MINAPDVITSEHMLYVYRLPEKLTSGYCFGGGVPILFMNVDWFGGAPDSLSVGQVVDFIKGKKYYDPAARFLVLSGAFAFTIEPGEK